MPLYRSATASERMDQTKITHCIEALCQKGCKEVARLILALERDEPVEEARELSREERQTVLVELKAVMAVYGEHGCCGSA